MALSAQPGVDALLLSGLRASVKMKGGAELKEESVRKAFEEKNLKLVSFTKAPMPSTKRAYEMAISGST